jgi:hypothetical protein
MVTLNSDVLSELPSDFDVKKYVLPVRLTDATDDGGLFGVRFEPPRGAESDGSQERPKKTAAVKPNAKKTKPPS